MFAIRCFLSEYFPNQVESQCEKGPIILLRVEWSSYPLENKLHATILLSNTSLYF